MTVEFKPNWDHIKYYSVSLNKKYEVQHKGPGYYTITEDNGGVLNCVNSLFYSETQLLIRDNIISRIV